MRLLDPPEPLDWDERRLWFEEEEGRASQQGAGAISEQAAALMLDLQAVFCAGAWVAAIILAGAVAEAQLKRAGRPGQVEDPDQRWLRAERNRLLHEGAEGPNLTVDEQWRQRDLLERRARRAVRVTLSILYPSDQRSAL